MTPFHNMALMSPATTDADVDRHTEVFAEAVEALFAWPDRGGRRAARSPSTVEGALQPFDLGLRVEAAGDAGDRSAPRR